MPYKKRTYTRRPRRKTGAKVMRMVKNLSRRVQGEVKKHTVVNTLQPTSYLSPLIRCLNQIAQGDNVFEREANAIKNKYMLFRFGISHNSSVQTSSTRIIILQDLRQIDTVIPGVDQVLWSDSDVRSSLNPAFAGRFKILYDRIFWTNALTKTQIEGKVYKKIYFPTRYSSSSSTSLVKNGLYVIMMNNANPGECASMTYTCTIGYYDN